MVREFLLRFFPEFHRVAGEVATLRAEYQRVSGENLRLQDRLDAALDDRQRLWTTLQDCLTGERTAYQMHVNASWQRIGGGTPYPDAPHLPPSAVPKVQGEEPIGRRGRILPSELVAQRTSEYFQQVADKWR